MSKTETGVMVMKDGKAPGVSYTEMAGRPTTAGWLLRTLLYIIPNSAQIQPM